jgi:hypothetical protein
LLLVYLFQKHLARACGYVGLLMRKRTRFGLLFGSLLVGVIAATFFLSGTPLPTELLTPEPALMPVSMSTLTPNVTALSVSARVLKGVQGNYAELATQHQQALAQAMTTVGQLLATPQLADESWQAQVADAMNEVEGAYAALLRLQPSEEWRPFHQEMIAGAADCNAAMRVLDLSPCIRWCKSLPCTPLNVCKPRFPMPLW